MIFAIASLLSNRSSVKSNTTRVPSVYSSNRYLWLRREGGYTLVSRDILVYDLTPTAGAIPAAATI